MGSGYWTQKLMIANTKLQSKIVDRGDKGDKGEESTTFERNLVSYQFP